MIECFDTAHTLFHPPPLHSNSIHNLPFLMLFHKIDLLFYILVNQNNNEAFSVSIHKKNGVKSIKLQSERMRIEM